MPTRVDVRITDKAREAWNTRVFGVLPIERIAEILWQIPSVRNCKAKEIETVILHPAVGADSEIEIVRDPNNDVVWVVIREVRALEIIAAQHIWSMGDADTSAKQEEIVAAMAELDFLAAESLVNLAKQAKELTSTPK